MNNIAQQVLQGNLSVVKAMLESFDSIHIGKSSAGWRFLFDHNNQHWDTFEQYKEWISQFEIYSEYGTKYTQEEFWNIVEEKQSSVNAIEKTKNPAWYIIIDGYEFSSSPDFS